MGSLCKWFCVVQNRNHSGTLRAMSESIPAIESESPEVDAPENAQPAKLEKERQAVVRETGGPEGLEPTRYGDWERKGRCIDF